MSRKKQQKAREGGKKEPPPTHRRQPRLKPTTTLPTSPGLKTPAAKAGSFDWHLGALSHETKIAIAVILLSFAIGRAVIVTMAMLGVDPDFLRALGLEPGDFTALYFGSGQDLATALCQLDCQWYEKIWSDGYDMPPLIEPWWRRGRAPWAWFPMFPVSVRFISALLPLSATTVAYLFNGACSIAAAWLLYLMGKTHRNHRTGLIAASLFLTSPFSLYLTIPYTEALFNLLSIAALYMAYQKRWIASGLAMALLSATRPTGLFIAFAVLVIAIREVSPGGGGCFAFTNTRGLPWHLHCARLASPCLRCTYIFFMAMPWHS